MVDQSTLDSSDVANLSEQFFEVKEKFFDIDIGVYDYVLKCIDGPYLGKFVYINTSPNGEVIGGSADYDISSNPQKITMYIENAELSEKHAEIIFNQYCQYTMKDCSDHKTTKGTWVKVPTSGKGVDIYANQNLNRKYMINKHKYAFHFEETKESLREVELWMQSNHLHFARAMLVQEKITRLPQLFNLTKDTFNKYSLNEGQQKTITTKIKDLKANLTSNRQENPNSFVGIPSMGDVNQSQSERKQLLLKFTEGIQEERLISGQQEFKIGQSEKENFDIELKDSQLAELQLKIHYSHGSMHIVGQENEKMDHYITPSAYYQLFQGEQLNLQPGQTLMMGDLQFGVERYNTGVVAEPGYRVNMEDTYIICQDLGIDEQLKVSLIAVVDGHGGDWCANFLRLHLEDEVRKQLTDSVNGLRNSQCGINQCISQAFAKAFNNLDEEFHEKMPEISYKCGAAAVIVLIIGNRLYCANIGDSRAVLCRNASAINLSVDHKATRPDEIERVKQEGGMIQFGRVMNRLAVTRAFGDFEFKTLRGDNGEEIRRKYITVEPEVRQIELDPFIDDFIVLASDGLYDKFTSQEAVSYIRTKLGNMPFMEQDCQKVAKDIANEAIYGKHVRDNVTVVIVALNRGIKLS